MLMWSNHEHTLRTFELIIPLIGKINLHNFLYRADADIYI